MNRVHILINVVHVEVEGLGTGFGAGDWVVVACVILTHSDCRS